MTPTILVGSSCATRFRSTPVGVGTCSMPRPSSMPVLAIIQPSCLYALHLNNNMPDTYYDKEERIQKALEGLRKKRFASIAQAARVYDVRYDRLRRRPRDETLEYLSHLPTGFFLMKRNGAS
jgi:hypothetical protein